MGSIERSSTIEVGSAKAIRAHDWSTSPLGPRETWPAALTAIYEMMMASPLAMCAGWGPELTLVYNEAYADILAARHPAALGQRIDRVWHDVWADISPLIEQAMSGGQVHQIDMHLVMTRKGSPEDTYWTFAYSPLRDGGPVVGFLNIAIETTTGVLASQQLGRAHRQLSLRYQDLEHAAVTNAVSLHLFESIVQSDKSCVVAFDHAHRVLAFNRAHDDDLQRVMGRRQQLGDVLPDLFAGEQAASLKELMDRALAGERFVIVREFGVPGQAMPTWEITYTPIHDTAGQVIGAFHHARDISERVRAEAELANTQEALRQAQKLEAVGQLTGGVAHDFNNLLTVIKSSTDLLKRPNLSEERRTRYVGAISDTVERAAKLTGQLLAFARRQALKPEVFDTCESVRVIGDMMGTLTGSRIEIRTHLSGHRCYVDADPSQFDTALVNMAVNARDAMAGEGSIVIRVEPVVQIPGAGAHPAVADGFVAIALADTGCGIPPEQLDQIFEPFFTTKGVGHGTGLGLSQVFGFARQSGGEVTVTSAVGRGSTFTLYLPRVAAPPVVVANAGPEPLVDGHGTCVLVVEDNADVGTFAVQTLNDLGYDTVLAVDGPAALLALAGDADRFDVVFSDVMMPGMTGVELGQEIRRLYHDLPVVLTSGYSHVLAQNGSYGFELLHKPYSVEQLSRILRKAAARRRRRSITGS